MLILLQILNEFSLPIYLASTYWDPIMCQASYVFDA